MISTHLFSHTDELIHVFIHKVWMWSPNQNFAWLIRMLFDNIIFMDTSRGCKMFPHGKIFMLFDLDNCLYMFHLLIKACVLSFAATCFCSSNELWSIVTQEILVNYTRKMNFHVLFFNLCFCLFISFRLKKKKSKKKTFPWANIQPSCLPIWNKFIDVGFYEISHMSILYD